MEYGSVLVFVILAFCLGAVLIMRKDTIPPKLKRGMAIFALIMILVAFFLIVYNLLTMGSSPNGG
ncbi:MULTISPECIES: hypothetical protein [Paenibacillus]|uniref:Signal transduction histidine kinase n=2 Tax=Paenibacillus TaxID=44249 RepID=A0A1R1ER71_9BACL|nr:MULTISPECIES: hypothetical protein [Paenibacillus]PQP91086.1 hypothetical protein CPT76_00555 [Paenibacillus sp. AR247]OMF54343.1 hypothetical protein BK138_14220 [Paenibacillus rhizosphaerae]OXL82262.1 hypothetical protein BCV73_03590 [Paenibacillus sp. SSG-1]UYO04142.1 hypothetical protein K2F33_31735 [Paenibacillus sp. PSB04]GIO52596.1 hypothetical protein J21TS7_09140 [Paenibacillus cineris]